MPPRPVLAVALLLPFGVWSLAARVDSSQNQLISECRQKLNRLGFKSTVNVGVDKFDVTVTGVVPTLEDREKVRDALDPQVF